MAIENIFSDVDFNFIPHPNTGDLSLIKNDNCVKNSIKNLILTAFYERKFQPNIGSGVGRLLFEPSSPLLKVTLEKTIRQVIENYEPRAEVLNIVVVFNDENNRIDITVYFKIVNTLTTIILNVALNRTR